MPKRRKPHEERKPEDYMEAADNALELAKALAGQGGISDQDFLERMARSDELADHDGTTCGQCHYQIIGAQVALRRIDPLNHTCTKDHPAALPNYRQAGFAVYKEEVKEHG